MSPTLNALDLPLVRAYLEREAKDYNPPKDESWVSFRIDRIQECISKLEPKSVNWLRIISLGNAGCDIRELRMDPPRETWASNGMNANIYLCTCGKDSCWGNLSLEKKSGKGCLI